MEFWVQEEMGWRWGGRCPDVPGFRRCSDAAGPWGSRTEQSAPGGSQPMSSRPGSPAALSKPGTAPCPPLHGAALKPAGREGGGSQLWVQGIRSLGGGAVGEGGTDPSLLGKLLRPLLYPNPVAHRAAAFSTRAGGTVSQRAVSKPAAPRRSGGDDHARRGCGSPRSPLGFSSPALA